MEVTHGSTVQLLDLPPEVIIHILSYLDFADALAVSRVNVFLRTCLTTSQELHFRLGTQLLGVTNNPHFQSDLSDRIRMLRMSGEGWANFSVDFHKTLPVLHEPFGIYDLSGGIYLMGDQDQKVLRYCRLPSSADDPMVWSRIDLDPSLTIVDVGLSIYEHDLIAVVTTKPTTANTNLLQVEVQLLEFSTGEPHPLARNPVLFVRYTFQPAASSIGLEIAGKYLALVTTPSLTETLARFCVFEWKTGVVVLDYPVKSGTYCSIVFLSPTHILLPNELTGTLDLFIVSPSNPNPPAPSLRLALPSIRSGYSIRAIYGRSEPNPAPAGFPHSTHPFHPTPEDAIAIFKMHIRNNQEESDWGDFSMFTHRSTLLRLCEEHSGGHGEKIRWEEWGPLVTRWFNAASVPWWITTATGQRSVMNMNVMRDGLEAGSSPAVLILDFNPLFVKKVLAEYGTQDSEDDSLVDGRLDVNVDPSSMETNVFKHAVKSALPYVRIIRVFADHNFDAVLMDEERLLGLTTDEEGMVRKIDVFHIGGARGDCASSSSSE
ncbi:hypothetical protein C0995_013209 [Termitomyces sp. Mi166|nr:hypothetical protein C0995_013209 [Termitomyces sp. Mi166\